MSYSVQNIRNVALLGHGGQRQDHPGGEHALFDRVLDRQGRTTDGNTVCDYDAEEIKRQISISTALAPVEYNGCKINVLDTPGNYDFSGEVQEALRVAELGIIVCDAKSGLSVGTERAWKYLNQHKLPRFIYISKMDEDNGDFNGAFATLREHFGRTIAPLVIPHLGREQAHHRHCGYCQQAGLHAGGRPAPGDLRPRGQGLRGGGAV